MNHQQSESFGSSSGSINTPTKPAAPWVPQRGPSFEDQEWLIEVMQAIGYPVREEGSMLWYSACSYAINVD